VKRIIGQVVNGKFIDGKPSETNNREHSLHKEFNRLDMRDKYARDIVQPFKGGQPNPEYIEAFGKQEATNQFGIESEIL
jgi:hypothetical protein